MTYCAFVRDLAFEVDFVSNGASALRIIEEFPPDILLLDVNLPDISGMHILRKIRSLELKTRVIVITSDASIQLAVQAMREGAVDFLVKPFSASQVQSALRQVRDRDNYLLAAQEKSDPILQGVISDFIGTSPAIRSVQQMIKAAATSSATVFITGESGSGKEVCASAMHANSNRSDKPFVALNCAAIPPDLLESEIFGHVKGAFTGASSDRLGAALSADGGTLFLDEIGEMDLAFQAKILRFLETRKVQRVGEDKTRACDVRIICATNRDPYEEVAAGRFREDLFYRLHVLPIRMPALRERGNDVITLAEHFLTEMAHQDYKTFSGFSETAKVSLLDYNWPGNIRQLKNCIQRLVVMHPGGVIHREDLPIQAQAKPHSNNGRDRDNPQTSMAGAADANAPNPQELQPLDSQIDAAIAQAIAACGGSISKAAELLKIAPSTIYRRGRLKSDADQ